MKISQSYSFEKLPPEKLYKWSRYCMQEIGATEIREKPYQTGGLYAEISGTIWNYMRLTFTIFRNDGVTTASLSGEEFMHFHILAKPHGISTLMNEYLKRLADKLQSRETYSFSYTPVLQSFPRFQITGADTRKGALVIMLAFFYVMIRPAVGNHIIANTLLIMAFLICSYAVVALWREKHQQDR